MNSFNPEPIDVVTSVPSSKSILARLMILGALSDGRCVFDNAVLSDDTKTMLECLRTLGFNINYKEETKQLRITGENGKIPKSQAEIYVGNAGTAARFLTAMLSFSEGEYIIRASERMSERPMKDLLDSLRNAGVNILCLEKEGYFPIKINGKKFTEPVEISIDVSKSTQFASAVILCGSLLPEGSRCIRVNERRNSYIRMTEKLVDRFGKHMLVESDWSSAAYCFSAAAVLGGRVKVNNIQLDSVQGDSKIAELLTKMGGLFSEDKEGVTVEFKKSIVGTALDFDEDMSDYSDQSMTLATLGALLNGTTTIKNIGHIRLQECDRINALYENFLTLGIKCTCTKDSITVTGGNVGAGMIKAENDHRIAMSFGLLKLVNPDIEIDNPDCVKKTFPGYNSFMSSLRQQ